MVQPVEEMIFDSTSTQRYKNIFRHETELKWIKSFNTPFRLGFNDNIYHEGKIQLIFSLLDVCKPNKRSRGKRKNGNLKLSIKTKLFGHLQIYVRS